jgi:hypothetical protein
MSSLKSNGKKQHHYGGAGSYSENSNQKMIMSIVGIFCFIVLIWFVYRRGQETCPVSSTSGTRASGTRAGRKANMMRAGNSSPTSSDPCYSVCNPALSGDGTIDFPDCDKCIRSQSSSSSSSTQYCNEQGDNADDWCTPCLFGGVNDNNDRYGTCNST